MALLKKCLSRLDVKIEYKNAKKKMVLPKSRL